MPSVEQMTIQDSSKNTTILPLVTRLQIGRQGSFKPKWLLIPIEISSEEKSPRPGCAAMPERKEPHS
jgi:hypothetical protein